MINLKEFIKKLDGFTYWRVIDNETLEDIYERESNENEYEIMCIEGRKNEIKIYVDKIN
jgi:hypothetical protein